MTNIGWVGMGVMGGPMARRLVDEGHRLWATTRTKAKAEPYLDEHLTWADTHAAIAAEADVIFTMVGYPDDVAQVYLGEDGLLSVARPGTLLVDMTTTKPSLAQEIAIAADDRGLHFVDAPVSGGDVGARNGTLSIMVGGHDDAVKRVMPLFEHLGKNIIHQGASGAGQHAKMCNQIVIAGTMIGMCESLIYGSRAGLNLEVVLQSITRGAAGCWSLDNLAPRILKGDYEPGFYVDHFVKDMGIALDEAARMNLALPGLALVRQLYESVRAMGAGKKGTQALTLALANLNGVEIKQS